MTPPTDPGGGPGRSGNPAREPRDVDLLISGGTVVTMDADGRVIESGAVAIDGSRIVAVGEMDSVQASFRGRERLDARGHLILPGLINAHTHMGDLLFRGLVEGLALEPWLERLWEAERAFVSRDSVTRGVRLALAEMILGGTTTALDMFFFPQAAAEVAREVGFRLMTGPLFFDTEGPEGLSPQGRLDRGRDFLEEWRDDSLITTCVEPHNHLTVSPDLLCAARDLANDFGVFLHTHAAETATECRLTHERFGRTPVQHLDHLGILDGRTALAHAVHLTHRDLTTMRDRAAVAVHNPVSNLKLGSGIAPVGALEAAGVPVALGTDGPVSSNDLDMWIAMRFATLLPRGVHADPTRSSAERVLRMATIEAARALGLDHRIGSLEPGKRADLIWVDLRRPHLVPVYDVYALLAFSVGRADVTTAIIDGQLVMRDRHLLTLDIDQAIDDVLALAEEISRHGT